MYSSPIMRVQYGVGSLHGYFASNGVSEIMLEWYLLDYQRRGMLVSHNGHWVWASRAEPYMPHNRFGRPTSIVMKIFNFTDLGTLFLCIIYAFISYVSRGV
jgi:hypothetical protein